MLPINQLAFFENPMALIIVGALALVLFGPEKMKEFAMQFGKTIRDVRKMGTDFKKTLDGEDIHENSYKSDYTPAQYDSYGNRIEEGTSNYSSYLPEIEDSKTPEIEAKVEPQRGDFAASAFADTSSEYGVAPEAPASVSKPEPPTPTAPEIKTAENTVSRSKKSVGV